MKNPNDGSGLPRAMLQKLEEIRGEDRRVRFQTGLLRGLAILIFAMLLAMAIDGLFVLREEPWRWAVTLLALIAGLAALAWGCLPPLLKTRSLASIAREVDEANPSLEERYQTIAGMAQSPDKPELRGSDALLDKVTEQAVSATGAIAVGSVVSREKLVHARMALGGVLAALLLVFIVDFRQAKTLLARFWAPGSEITMTHLAAKPGDAVIGRGDDVTLEIDESGKLAESADLFVRGQNRDDVIPLRRDSKTDAKFTYMLNSVAESFEYRARAGDGQTEWHRVTVMDRPKISEVKMRIVPPAYSHLPVVEQEALPRQARALEGSQLEVSFKSDEPLASMELKFSDGKSLPIFESADHTYHFNTTLSNTLAFKPVFTNLNHLDNLEKPTCEINVYPDQPPTVTVSSPKNEITARKDDKIKINFEARDDFGVAKAELVVNVKNETNTITTVIPIPLTTNEAGAKLVRKEVELDLAKFNLKQDQELTYYVQVKDTKENPAQSNRPQETQSSTSPPQAAKDQPQLAKSDSKKASNGQNPEKGKAAETNSAAGQRDPQKHLAMNPVAPKPQDQNPDEPKGAKPPPNNMTRRVLDAGQSSCCSPMKVVVDEWGRSFEAQMREKLEIAIDPVLKSLDSLLGKAEESTDATISTGRSALSLTESQRPAVESARDNLRQADSAVSELKKITFNTPYAFIGLQVTDIRDSHISPARQDLGNVSLQAAAFKGDMTNLEQASFEIKTAREHLANLTKTYAAVKRDNKLADAMQRLAKMHQIFLEDSQALLNPKKPILNPMDRKTAEVSDEFAEKYRKLLEEQKKIMAELAKILADDPRLLRRFMALEQLDGTTLRDQMTVLAQRQQALARESAQWSAAAEKDRAALSTEMLLAQTSEQTEIAGMTSKLLENMETWVPLDVPVNQEPFTGCRVLAAEAARLSAEAAKQAVPDTIAASLVSASNALEKLRSLQAALPGLDWVMQSPEKVSVFEANRLNESAELITRQSGWIKKMESLRAGDYAQAAEVDQHHLMLDTATLSEKLDSTVASVGSLSEEIKMKAEELTATVHQQILTEEDGATTALSHKTVPEAASHQAAATNAFARGEREFDDLLHLIIAKLDAAPPPTEVGTAKSLEDLLKQLQDEKKAAESLGIPCRPMNIQVLKDWMQASSCQNPGSCNSPAQAKATQQQAREAQKRLEQTRDKAKELALQRVEALPPTEYDQTHVKTGPKHPAASWNTLVSQLGDELRQGRDNAPPEQYRQAIEQYFSTIAEKAAEAAVPAPAPAPAAK